MAVLESSLRFLVNLVEFGYEEGDVVGVVGEVWVPHWPLGESDGYRAAWNRFGGSFQGRNAFLALIWSLRWVLGGDLWGWRRGRDFPFISLENRDVISGLRWRPRVQREGSVVRIDGLQTVDAIGDGADELIIIDNWMDQVDFGTYWSESLAEMFFLVGGDAAIRQAIVLLQSSEDLSLGRLTDLGVSVVMLEISDERFLGDAFFVYFPASMRRAVLEQIKLFQQRYERFVDRACEATDACEIGHAMADLFGEPFGLDS